MKNLLLLAQVMLGITLSTPVTFAPGPAASNTSTLAANPNSVTANGTSTTTLTFTAVDAFYNPAPGTTVNLSTSGGNNTFGAVSGVTDNHGLFITTLASTYAQSEVITASFGSGFSVTTTVQFVPGAASNAASSLVLNLNAQVANNSNVITALLTLKDAQGNPIPNIVPTFTASGSSTNVSSPLATSTSGQSSATYRTTLAQNENALVTGGGLSFVAPMAFIAGPPNAAASTLAASPNIAAGNGSAAITLIATVRDAQGNAVSGANVALSASGGNNTFAAANGNTTTSGTYTTTLQSTLMQTETVSSLIAGNFNETVSVTFTGNANATTSSLVVNPNTQTVGPSNSITATLTLRDAASNPLAGLTPTWSASGGNNTITNYGATSSSGQATGIYSSTLAQNENISVSAAGLSFLQPVSFIAGSPNASTSYFYALPPRQLANDNNTIVATIMLYDAYSNAISGFSPAFAASGSNTTVFGATVSDSTGKAQATYKSATIQNQNALVTAGGLVLAAPIVFTDIPTQCVLVANPNVQPADGNSALTMSATVTNSSHQPIPGIQVVFSSTGGAQQFLSQNVVTNNLGQATSGLDSLYAGANTLLAQAANVQCATQGNFLTRTAYCPGNPNYNTLSSVTSGGPYNITATDFNGDGALDIAMTGGGSTIGVYLGTGTGTFQAQATYNSGSATNGIIATDFDGDGKQDLAVANMSTNTIGIFLGSGTGTFQPQKTYAAGSTPFGITSGDFDGDGKQDIVITNHGSKTIGVFLGTGTGAFQTQMTFSAGNSPDGITTGDFNADGKQDIAIINTNDASLGVFLGLGTGVFQNQVTYATGNGPTGITVGDFNGDGKQDLAVLNASSTSMGIFLGTGTGTFQNQVTYATGSSPTRISIGDFNGDSKQDLLVTNNGSATFGIFLGTGTGAFQNQVTYTTGSGPFGALSGDFNGDGRQDVAIVSNGGNALNVYLTRCP